MTDTSTGRRPWELPRDRSGWLDFETYGLLLRADAGRLREVAAMGLEAPVPSCPGWTVADVVAHTAEVYEHKVACTRLGHAPDPWPPPEGEGREPIAAFDDALGDLLRLFESHDNEHPSHTWWPPDQTVGFWMRRMALETAVHRVDVELAHDVVTPVDRELARDGIDELFVMMLAGDEWAEHGTEAPVDAVVRLTCAGRSWTVTLDADAVTVDRSAAGEAAVEIAGDPSALYLWLWGRGSAESLVLVGDQEVAAGFRRRLSEATQ
jgi:uncharacterized protein (TIGR03083 family)